MGDRRQARELALQALFFLDMDGVDTQENTDKKMSAFCAEHQDKLTQSVEPFFNQLISGVISNQSKIDRLLETSSKNWKLSRMPVVDRNIMRIAIYELLECADIPSSVTINEAVEIGKRYGTKDSGPFINGVLDRIKISQGIN